MTSRMRLKSLCSKFHMVPGTTTVNSVAVYGGYSQISGTLTVPTSEGTREDSLRRTVFGMMRHWYLRCWHGTGIHHGIRERQFMNF